MKKYLLLILSLTLIVFSCSDGDDDPVIVVEEPMLTLKSSTVDFSNEGGTQSVSFETKLNWTAKSSETWCDVSPKSGGGGVKVVTITATANKEYDNRSCSITITSGNLSKTITVKQGEKLGLLVSQERYELSNNESTIEVEVKANVDFEIDISDDWITDISSRGLTSTKLEFLIAKNEQYDSREGTITITQKGGSMKSVIKVFQSQEDAIIISEKSVNISSEAQIVDVEVKTNVDFEILISNDIKDWVSITETRGLRTETFALNIEENKTYNDRSAQVYVKNKKTNLQDTLTVNQAANMGLLVTQDRYELSNEESSLEVEVKSNIEFNVKVSDEWITQVETRGLVSTILNFNIAKNESYSNREGKIIITQKDGDLSSTITVFQSQKDAIILSEKLVEVSKESQEVEVEVKTNVDLEVIIPEVAKNWVSYTPTRGLHTEILILDIAENRYADARSSEVYVKNKATKLQDTLTIVQEKGLGVPVLTTIKAYDILAKSAKTGGVITFDGGDSNIEKGVCWGIVENPTIEDSTIKSGVATDNFDIKITGLEANTTYYARAFAENKWGISYGNEITFTTLSIVATPVISPSGGTFSEAQTITMTCDTEDAKIMYTLDGSNPNESSTLDRRASCRERV